MSRKIFSQVKSKTGLKMLCSLYNESYLKHLINIIEKPTSHSEDHTVKNLITNDAIQFSDLTTCIDKSTDANLNLICKILITCVKCPVFYQKPSRVRYTIEFILLILHKQCEPFLNILQLVYEILLRIKQYMNPHDVERLTAVLQKITKTEQQEHVYIKISGIACELIFYDKWVNETILKIFLIHVLQKLNQTKNTKEINRVIYAVMKSRKNLGLEEYIVQTYPLMLKDIDDESTINDLIICLKMALETYKNVRHQLLRNLLTVVLKLCKSMCLDCTRVNAKAVLKEVILYFCETCDVPWLEDYELLDELLDNLPKNLKSWIFSNNDVVIMILFMIHSHIHFISIWNEDEVSKLLANRLNNSKYLPTPVLKASFYLYPYHFDKFNVMTAIANENLIKHIEYSSYLSRIISYDEFQLRWVLQYATANLKYHVLYLWITNDYFTSTVVETVAKLIDGNIWTKLFETIDYKIAKNIAHLLSSLNDSELSETFTNYLIKTVYKPQVFNILLLSKPSIPKTDLHYIQLCTLLGAQISSFADIEVFETACSYINQMLYAKQLPEALRGFCRNISNLRMLVQALINADNDVSCKVAHLLHTILKLQIKFGIVFEETVLADAMQMFRDIPRHMSLIHDVLFYGYNKKQKIYITFTSDSITQLFYRLHDFVNFNNYEVVFNCLVIILQQNDWLIHNSIPSNFIGNYCTSAVFNNVQFLEYIACYLTIIKDKTGHHSLYPIHSTITHFLSHLQTNFDSKQLVKWLITIKELLEYLEKGVFKPDCIK